MLTGTHFYLKCWEEEYIVVESEDKQEHTAVGSEDKQEQKCWQEEHTDSSEDE